MPRGGHDIPVSGTHLKGTHEVVTKGVDPTIKGAFYCETPTLRDHFMGTLQVEAHSQDILIPTEFLSPPQRFEPRT